ncbi:hypothetical protein AB0L71_07015 [Streptomyces sp. NPDC052052]|uniref:hypothetical protein n=1 Tax=Streptomyces sp. NPDC052052 TaxID=3154756 RepID=UPI00342FD872
MNKLIKTGVTALAAVLMATVGVASAHAEGRDNGGPCFIYNTGDNAVNACHDAQNGSGHVAGSGHTVGTTNGNVGLPDPSLPFFRVGSTNTTYRMTLTEKIGFFDPAPDNQTILNDNGQLFWPTIGLTGAIYTVTDSVNAFRGNVSLTFDVRNPQDIIWRCESSPGSPITCPSPSGGQLDTIKFS